MAEVVPLGIFGIGEDDAGGMDWQDRALCAQTDPEAFFPEKGGSTREAKRICQGCDVRAECLEYALAHDERIVEALRARSVRAESYHAGDGAAVFWETDRSKFS